MLVLTKNLDTVEAGRHYSVKSFYGLVTAVTI
jgi:hypothetical protein